MKADASNTPSISRLVRQGYNIYMIFGKDGIDEMLSYTDVCFTTEAEADAYIANVLEADDKEAGIYEPGYYTIIEATDWYK